MYFKKRLVLAFGLGILFHAGVFMYLNHHEIHLLPMQRQGVLEWAMEEDDSTPTPIEELSREEVMHAFFSPIAPENTPFEALTSSPEPLEEPLLESSEELRAEDSENIDYKELAKEVRASTFYEDTRLSLSSPDISPMQESSDGIIAAEELLEHLELDGIAFGKESDDLNELENPSLNNTLLPQVNFHQGLALSESTLWAKSPEEHWEKDLIASLETQNTNFTQFFRGKETLANSDTFQAKVEYLPRASHGDYLFKISLSPRQGKHFKRIKQNIFFLLDRSNSIDRRLYYKTRDALSETLPLIHPEDHFNVLVFDDDVTAFSDSPILATEENIANAQNFLLGLKHGGIFAATDLYKSLDEIIPQEVSSQEANTAILLSDGDTFLSLEKQRRTIGQWTEDNKGKVSLFSFAIGKKNNLPLLDAISSFNRGMLVHSPSIATLPYTLKNFIQSIRYPLGKNFKATVIPSETYMEIQIYPKNKRLPLFYENIPYTLYGRTTHLEEFSLFLQGKHYHSWLDIQVPISFSDAKLADASIEKQFAIQQVYDHYESFFETGSMYPLMQARDLLAPFDIETAFGID